MSRVRARTAVAASLALVALALLVLRIHLGADYTDESQYAAQTMGPLIGGRPFVTDLFLQQSASLLVTPMAALYLKLRGDTEGIVLFLRWVYVALTLMAAGAFFFGMRSRLSAAARWILIAGLFAHIPFCIPAPSYNSFGLLFFVIALSFTVALRDRGGRATGAVMGVSAVLAAFCYPPLIIATLPLAPALWRRPGALWSVLGAFTTGCFLAGFCGQSGWDNLKAALDFTQAASVSGFWEKFAVQKGALISLYPGHGPLMAAAVVAAILLALRRYNADVGLGLTAAASVGAFTTSGLPLYFSTLVYAVPFVILGEIASPRWFRRPFFSFENALVASPIVAGLVSGWSSSNGVMNAALGFSVALLFIYARSFAENRRWSLIPWAAMLVIWTVSNFTYFYREAALPQLTERIPEGPFAGLYTSAARAMWLERFNADFRVVPPQAQSILFFDQFPAGYLFSQRTPKTFLYFMHPAYYLPWLRPKMVQYFSDPVNLPDAVVQFFQLPLNNESYLRIGDAHANVLNDPFWDFFARHPDYLPVLKNEAYAIYLRKMPISK